MRMYENRLNFIGDTDDVITQLIAYIRENCSEFLSLISSGQYLYRGNIKLPDAIVVLDSPQDRNSRDLSPVVNAAIDRLLTKLQSKALRSNSFFCTGNSEDAASYGSLYYTYPLNGFNYTWSPYIKDLYTFSLTNILGDLNMLLPKYDPKKLYEEFKSWYRSVRMPELLRSKWFEWEYYYKKTNPKSEIDDQAFYNREKDRWLESMQGKMIGEAEKALEANIPDFNSIDFTDYIDSVLRRDKENGKKMKLHTINDNLLFDKYGGYFRVDNGLDEAIDTEYEIMIHGKCLFVPNTSHHILVGDKLWR